MDGLHIPQQPLGVGAQRVSKLAQIADDLIAFDVDLGGGLLGGAHQILGFPRRLLVVLRPLRPQSLRLALRVAHRLEPPGARVRNDPLRLRLGFVPHALRLLGSLVAQPRRLLTGLDESPGRFLAR